MKSFPHPCVERPTHWTGTDACHGPVLIDWDWIDDITVDCEGDVAEVCDYFLTQAARWQSCDGLSEQARSELACYHASHAMAALNYAGEVA